MATDYHSSAILQQLTRHSVDRTRDRSTRTNSDATRSLAALHQLHGDCHKTAPDFRCQSCGDLLEIIFPRWSDPRGFEPSRLRELWRERKLSDLPVGQSGVWRFRELLPKLAGCIEPVILREGNTPLMNCLIVRVKMASTGFSPNTRV